MQASFTGNLLVASSSSIHPMYAGGVCLIVHQDNDQTIGVMLNRPMIPSPEAMGALFGTSEPPEDDSKDDQGDSGDVSTSPSMASAPRLPQPNQPPALPMHLIKIPMGQLHFGGPISGPVVALHRSFEHAEIEPVVGIYVAAQREHLEQLIAEHSEAFRLIVGHLRWTNQELAQEIEAGWWHVLPATVDNAFLPAHGMWPRLVRRATARSLASWIGTPDVEMAGELN
jgi:putative transcriptional regulator